MGLRITIVKYAVCGDISLPIAWVHWEQWGFPRFESLRRSYFKTYFVIGVNNAACITYIINRDFVRDEVWRWRLSPSFGSSSR